MLVKLRYAPGWRLPGGGRRGGEYAQATVIRELREEIGMTAYGRIRFACELEEEVDFKRDLASLLIVEDVRYLPRRWSWEVQHVDEFALDGLPKDIAPTTLRWINALRDSGFRAHAPSVRRHPTARANPRPADRCHGRERRLSLARR